MAYDYDLRLTKLQEIMKAKEIDAFIVSSKDGIYYLSGASYEPVERPFFIFVKQEGPYDLIVPYLEFEHMKKVSNYGSIQYYFEYPTVAGNNWYDILRKCISTLNTVAVEPEFSLSKSQLLNHSNIIVSDAITELRMIKDADEIEAIRNAAKWTDKGMGMLFENLYTGTTVIETSMHGKKLQTGIISGGEYDFLNCSFLTIGWPAPKSSQPHSVPDLHMKMGKGPIVLMSYNRINGYAAECERTVFLGEPSEKEKELYNIVMNAREIAFSMVRPGVKCAEIDSATQDFFEKKGYGKNIIHRTGHGIGLGNHEQPWLSLGSNDVLAENMVISIEPALYFDDTGGFRHSDTVLVTKDGYEVITNFPTALDKLVIRDKRTLKKLKGKIIRKAINY